MKMQQKCPIDNCSAITTFEFDDDLNTTDAMEQIHQQNIDFVTQQHNNGLHSLSDWREYVDERIEEIAKHNQYITSDMIIGDLERHGKGLSNYSPLGPALQAAQRKGIIEKQPTSRKSKRPSTVWLSKIYKGAN